ARIERLEHSIAAQALVPKFEPPRVEIRPAEPQVDLFRELLQAADSNDRSTSSFDLPTARADVADEAKSESEDELAPFAEFSIWRQGAASAGRAADGLADAGYSNESAAIAPALPSAEPAATSSDKTRQVAPAKSFIEQYGHMFADGEAETEAASDVTPNVTAAKSADSDSIVRRPQNLGRIPTDGDAPAAASDEEETIEQYMSKLLQRVRGDQPPVGNPQSLGSISALGFETSPPATSASVGTAPKPIATASEHSAGAGKGDWLTTSLGTVRRKAPMVEQPADLAALRALANETARRAISTHGLRIHRRKAITKVIVSMLAGMTSLWLMLDAGNWRNLQFITACVTLIAAAYWAGQTFCELIETFRAAAYDGPEDKLQGFASLPAPSSPAASNSQVEVKS
ncbi:MAG TPA: hypothetical protein VHK01_02230, partial [Lacipirellulaceae bacterium]|nr:hypothetical protein [Lacipirellulaceae bacterium]